MVVLSAVGTNLKKHNFLLEAMPANVNKVLKTTC